jgi:dihydrolipoamide dehydrogenase
MSEAQAHYDLVVVGAGPGGYVAAIRAAQLGAKVCLVEKDAVGGICLNRGCIPTKALAASAAALETIRHGADYGLTVAGVAVDFPAVMARSRATVEKLGKGVHYLLRKHGVTLLRGRAALAAPRALAVETAAGTELISGSSVIIATGSKPVVMPAFGYDGVRVVTSDEVTRLSALPARLLIIGGGVVGCEYASIFNALGSQVTVVEALPSILPLIDKEVARQLAAVFRRRGIKVVTGAKVEQVEKGEEIKVSLAGAEPITCDMVLIAVGRRPNTAGLDLAKWGVEVNARGEIVVDECMRTTAAEVYAVGDVCFTPWKLAHVASRQGIVAAHNAMRRVDRLSYDAVPSAIFTLPEVATVGLSAEAAKEAGYSFRTAKFPFAASGKAVAEGHIEGFVKVLADNDDDRLLGVHIIGQQAATLIAEAVLAIQHRFTVDQLLAAIHAHPTLPEALAEAVEGLHGLTIHA